MRDYIVTRNPDDTIQVSLADDPERSYTVRIGPRGGHKCSCPHHYYRRAQCKHIQLAKTQKPWND